jgi:hypothetical protein
MALVKILDNAKFFGKTILGEVASAPVFTPTTISGLQLWLDASDSSTLFDATAGGNLVTTDGAVVARWADKSGNNRHATQTTANARPLLKTSIKNGRNVLRFDGANDSLWSSSWNLTLTQQTVFAVFRSTWSGVTANYARIFTQSDASKDYQSANNYIPLTRNNASQIASYSTNFLSPINYTNNVWAIATSVHTGTTVTNKINSATGSTANNVLNKTVTRYAIGDQIADGGLAAGSINGDVLEILVYSSALTTTQRQAVETYLNNKWAIY